MSRFIPVKLKLTSVLESSLRLYDFSPETPVSDTVNGNARTLVAGTGVVGGSAGVRGGPGLTLIETAGRGGGPGGDGSTQRIS